jgi:hypothetical protein
LDAAVPDGFDLLTTPGNDAFKFRKPAGGLKNPVAFSAIQLQAGNLPMISSN